MYKSSFSGVIEELPGVYADNFERADEVQARAYFLSHCHSDHTQGLFSDTLKNALKRTGASIYMSEPTAAIIEDEAADKTIVKFIKPLKLEPTIILLPEDSQRNYEELLVTVSIIPAGHSFGSVMFLFQTRFKTILFTGDFRVSPNELPNRKQLHNNNKPINIDVMYIDTTFLKHCYSNFPSRSESVEATIDEIRKWLRDKHNCVALHTSAKYGYEFVFDKIYKKLGMKVYVNDQRWSLYSKLKRLVPSVTNEESTRIHVCRNNSEKKDHTKCMRSSQAHKNYLYIHFSAMKWDHFDIDDKTVRIANNRLDVCFATHCSFSELKYFVEYFNPKNVVGFPHKYSKVEEKRSDENKVPAKKRKMAAIQDGAKTLLDRVDKEMLKSIFEL